MGATQGQAPAIAALLKDPEAHIREAAAGALSEVGEAAKEHVPAIAALLKDPEAAVRGAAAQALGKMRDAAKEQVPAIVSLLKDPGEDVQWAAAMALGEMGVAAKEHAPAIATLLQDPEANVRSAAAEALVEMGEAAKEQAPAIAALLNDPYRDVREAAAEVLDRMGVTKEQALAITTGGTGEAEQGVFPPWRPSQTISSGSGPVPSLPSKLPLEITNSIGIEFVLIPVGEFMMGSPESKEPIGTNREKPAHQVTISQPFYLGKYEVTQAQWRMVMGENPSEFKGDTLPVENVSWDEIQEFIKKLNKREGKEACRLPTEAQWEYAARAGTTTRYSFGHDPEPLDDYAWYMGNAGDTTHPVGQKKPNAWGFYDMHGNVWEWVQDWYDVDYYQNSPTVDPQGPDAGVYRAIRGGGWNDTANIASSTARIGLPPDERDVSLGFRCLSSGVSE